MSISEDRKEIEVFVNFEMNVAALGLTGGHTILKAGDPLARDSADTGRLKDYLEPRSSEKGRQTDEEGNFFDHRAYCYSVPSMAPGSDKWALMSDPVTILDDHAEAKFPGAVGRWYLVHQDEKVGYIPAAYLKGAA